MNHRWLLRSDRAGGALISMRTRWRPADFNRPTEAVFHALEKVGQSTRSSQDHEGARREDGNLRCDSDHWSERFRYHYRPWDWMLVFRGIAWFDQPSKREAFHPCLITNFPVTNADAPVSQLDGGTALFVLCPSDGRTSRCSRTPLAVGASGSGIASLHTGRARVGSKERCDLCLV